MFVTGDCPSGNVAMLALFLDPGTIAPAWARPSTGSFSLCGFVRPKLLVWAFHVS
jgi:hypothetical protein